MQILIDTKKHTLEIIGDTGNVLQRRSHVALRSMAHVTEEPEALAVVVMDGFADMAAPRGFIEVAGSDTRVVA
jgi:hypothetical protein